MRNRFLDERTARDIDTLVAKILRGLGNPDPPLVLDDVRALQKLDRHYYSSVDDRPLREFVSRAYIGAKQVFSRPTLILEVVRKRSLKAIYLPDRKRVLIDVNWGLIRTMLPGSKSGKARTSRAPIFA